MNHPFLLLLGAAFTMGILHTLAGPDHYLPFIALSRAGNWPLKKTLRMTALCGLGHILSAVAVAFLALKLGTVLFSLEKVEAIRGNLAAWALTVFGFSYALWGLRKVLAGKKALKEKAPAPLGEGGGGRARRAAGWIVFLIFVLGPCEPLIPFILFPETTASGLHLLAVTSVFGTATLLTMLAAVAAAVSGLKLLPSRGLLGRYGHTLAGGVIGSCGLAMTFLGL